MIKKFFIIVILIIASMLFADYQSCLQKAIEDSEKEGWSESEELVAIAACQYNYGKFEMSLETLIKADSMGLSEEYRIYTDLIISQLYAELGNYNRALIYNEDVIAQQITN